MVGIIHPVVHEAAMPVTGKVMTGWTVLGQPGINRLAIGVGMIPRGEVGLVFAGIGSASGVTCQPDRPTGNGNGYPSRLN